MSQTYAQIQKQIESLQHKAEALRRTELKGVVDRIKVAIAHYGLTPDQLFAKSAATGKASAATPSKADATASAKFADGKGNVWSGRGPRPRWLREALEAGAQLDDFSAIAPSSTASRAASLKKTSKRAPSKVVYTDGAGHRWTGRGPKPGWVKDALASGKELKDLAE